MWAANNNVERSQISFTLPYAQNVANKHNVCNLYIVFAGALFLPYLFIYKFITHRYTPYSESMFGYDCVYIVFPYAGVCKVCMDFFLHA